MQYTERQIDKIMSVEEVLDIDSDKTDQIYTDFSFLTNDCFSPIDTDTAYSPHSGSGQQVWGIHERKPVQQTAFERQIQESLDSVSDYYPHMRELDLIAEIEDSQYESRPRVFDGKSKRWVLVDTGSAVCVLPYRMSITY